MIHVQKAEHFVVWNVLDTSIFAHKSFLIGNFRSPNVTYNEEAADSASSRFPYAFCPICHHQASLSPQSVLCDRVSKVGISVNPCHNPSHLSPKVACVHTTSAPGVRGT